MTSATHAGAEARRGAPLVLSPITQQFREAVRHQRAGALDRADAIYRRILDAEPDNVDALTNFGVVCAALGRTDEALQHYRRALTLTPDDADILANLGNLYRNQGDDEQAEKAYRAALAANAGHVPAASNLIELLLAAGDAEGAVNVGQATLVMNPAANDIRVRIAAILYAADCLAEAGSLTEEALARDPTNARARSLMGELRYRAGDLVAAEAHWRAAVAADPNWGRPWHQLALLLAQGDDAIEAEAAFQRAIAANGGAVAHRDYGSFLRHRRVEDAKAQLEIACALDPNDCQAALDLGNLLYGLGKYSEALLHFERGRTLEPGLLEPAFNTAVTLDHVGRSAEAEASLRALVVRFPQHAGTRAALAHVQYRRGLTHESLATYREAVALAPDDPTLQAQLGRALAEAGQNREALAMVESALAKRPDDTFALKVRGQVQSTLGRHAEAIASLERAMHLTSAKDVNTLLVLANVLEHAKRREEALRAYELVRRQDPDNIAVVARATELKLTLCNWRDYDSLVSDINRSLEHSIAKRTPVTFCIQDLQNVPIPWGTLAGAAKVRAEEVMVETAALRVHTNFSFDERLARWRDGERRRVRIGYALPYTFLHSFPLLMRSISERHDRRRFEIFGYSVRPGDGPFDRDYRATFDHFRDVPQNAPEVAARMVYDDQIDILIDVTGHTGIHCQPLMSMRPAPVSMHMLGYGITTGASYMDYLLSDSVWMRPELRHHVTENVVYMPDSWFIGFHGWRSDRTFTRAELGLPDEGFVFCNFNQPFKFEPSIFATWMRILKRVPNSVMWLGAWDLSTQRNLRREAAAYRVDPQRLVVADIVDMATHGSRLSCADLALDCRYHAGGVTTIDVLWAGVPIVTCQGHMPTSGNGRSLSVAHGVPEMAVASLEEYEERAVALATDPVRYRALRKKVEDQRETGNLFNRERYVRHLEWALERMWDDATKGIKSDIHVPAELR